MKSKEIISLCQLLSFLLFSGRPFDKSLVHTMESVVIEWSHQIQSVLKKNSAQQLLDGKNPGPLVEVEFWKDRVGDLESVMDQLITDKAQKMSALLQKTQSTYYPALQNMVSYLWLTSPPNYIYISRFQMLKLH